MRNNKSLAVAITTALSLAPGMATALVGNQLDNVNGGTSEIDANDVSGGALFNFFGEKLFRPDSRFDFTGGQTIIDVQKDGVPLAAELFSTGNVVIPTPITGTGQYMALVYTIDGEIIADFNMTFTLDGGATFAENPILGVRDTAAGGTGCAIGTVNSDTTSTANKYAWSVAATDGCLTLLSLDETFRFDTNSTLYQVAVSSAAGATQSTVPSSITFYQLGRPAVAPIAISGTPSKIYGSSSVASSGTSMTMEAVGTVGSARVGYTVPSAGTIGATTLIVENATGFTVGWSYQCADYYGPSDATLPGSANRTIFTVVSNPSSTATAAGSYPLVVKAVASSIAGVGGFNSAGATGDGFGPLTMHHCDPATPIYRVHIKGDTAITVVDASKFTVNNIYQFGGVDGVYAAGAGAASKFYTVGSEVATALLSTQTAQYQVTATDSKTSTITVKKVCAQNDAACATATGLEKTLWGAERLYDTVIDMGDDWSTANTVAGVPMAASGATGKNVATFTLKAGTTTPTALKLNNNDQIMLLYRLGTASKLAEAGQSINMSVDLKTPSLGISVNPARTTTVARSVQAINAQLKSIEAGILHIAVSAGSTQFSGENTGGLQGFYDNYIAQIGQVMLEYSGDGAVMEDGVTPFQFKGSAKGQVLASKSTLTITGGQFEASTALPGKAVLHLVNDSGEFDYEADPTKYTRDAEGWTAVWNLDTSQLQNIAKAGDGAIVRIRTDGKTPVNTVENNPVAILKIDYDTATYADVSKQNSLRKITKDGTVCTVYNVPPPKTGVIGADQLSIRVTNDSAIAGKLTGKLYGQEGGDPIWTGDLTTEEVPIGATARFTSEDLATITGVTWDGRAVLEISTIIPKIEVLALIRQNGIRMAPLSNLSAGAHGVSCAQE